MIKKFALLLCAASFITTPFVAFGETTTAQPPCPQILKSIARGAQDRTSVLELQRFLASHFGVASSTIVTGHFGPLTESYVKKFQLANGLPGVGNVGPLTRALLIRNCAGVQRPPSVTPPTCHLSATPATISAGESVTFKWTSTNATYAVWGSGDKENANETARIYTNISTTQPFALTFFGPGGSVTCSVDVTVRGTDAATTTLPILPRPPHGSICPALGWLPPTAPCNGRWAPTYGTTGCQDGWQCIGLPPTPPVEKPPADCPMISILPAPCSGTLEKTYNLKGCHIGFKCTPLTQPEPPIVKPPVACPHVLFSPIICTDGTLTPKYDANGCQTGFVCTGVTPPTPPTGSCTTPWGAKVVGDGQTIPNQPYFTKGTALTTSMTVPLMRCANGSWQQCDYQGNGCVPWVPPVTPPTTPPPSCPVVSIMPVPCPPGQILKPTYRFDGCQNGYQCVLPLTTDAGSQSNLAAALAALDAAIQAVRDALAAQQ